VKEAIVTEVSKLASAVLRLRYWQHVMNERLKEKSFSIPIHLGFGHEALAVALDHTMEAGDQLVLSHRNITYNLARAGALKPLYDEYKLKADAMAGGQLGSMNLVNPDRGIVYSSSILGNNVSVACGLALGRQVMARPGIVTVLTGDGAMEEGQFYESLVFAKSQDLKVLFVVENNDMSMSSTIDERRCAIDVEQMCAALDIPFYSFQGNDVFEYSPALKLAREAVDGRQAPVCIEAHLAALNQHAGPTPGWPTDPKTISLENGLVVEQSSNDPVYVLQKTIDSQAFAELTREVLAEDWNEV